MLSEDEDFDVILCDLMMCEMSGMELYEAVRASCPRLGERFVFVTGGAFTPGAREFLARAERPTLDKPFEADDLRGIVDDLVGRRGQGDGS